MHFIHSISNARHRKIKDGIRFSLDTLFIFDFDVCDYRNRGKFNVETGGSMI